MCQNLGFFAIIVFWGVANKPNVALLLLLNKTFLSPFYYEEKFSRHSVKRLIRKEFIKRKACEDDKQGS
jgi:hypothetical protein